MVYFRVLINNVNIFDNKKTLTEVKLQCFGIRRLRIAVSVSGCKNTGTQGVAVELRCVAKTQGHKVMIGKGVND